MAIDIFRVPVSYGASIFAEVIDPGESVPPGAPTVVMAHGWCLDHTSWHKVIDELQDRCSVRVVTYDQRGHGKSSMGEIDEPSVRILGDDLDEVILATQPEGPLVLVGHSMGGMSIMAYAGLHYERFTSRVHGTVLASTAASIEGRSAVPMESLIMAAASRAPGIAPRLLVPRLVQGRLLFGAKADKDDVRHAVHQIQHTKMPTIGRFFYAIANHDEVDALPHFVDVPTHIISGDDDRLIPVPHAEQLRERIPDADLTVLPDVGHMTIYEASDTIVDAIEDLLDRWAEPKSKRKA
ncbi:MAG: lipase [Actinomycetales bacterium]|nr:MAG: lipase [Actinomycetales bacterium]